METSGGTRGPAPKTPTYLPTWLDYFDSRRVLGDFEITTMLEVLRWVPQGARLWVMERERVSALMAGWDSGFSRGFADGGWLEKGDKNTWFLLDERIGKGCFVDDYLPSRWFSVYFEAVGFSVENWCDVCTYIYYSVGLQIINSHLSCPLRDTDALKLQKLFFTILPLVDSRHWSSSRWSVRLY